MFFSADRPSLRVRATAFLGYTLAILGGAFFLIPLTATVFTVCWGINWDATCVRAEGEVLKEVVAYIMRHADKLGIVATTLEVAGPLGGAKRVIHWIRSH